MPKKFKCPICGCDEHFKINSISESKRQNDFGLISYKNELYGDVYGSYNIIGNFETFVCKNCGHIQLFGDTLLKQLKNYSDNNKNELKKVSSEIKIIKAKIDERQKELEPVEKRINELTILLKRDDITIKQHKEYEKELEQLCSENSLKRIKLDLNHLNCELEKKENELKKIKEQQL